MNSKIHDAAALEKQRVELGAAQAVLTDADRSFCAKTGIDEEDFLATRQFEINEAAAIRKKRDS